MAQRARACDPAPDGMRPTRHGASAQPRPDAHAQATATRHRHMHMPMPPPHAPCHRHTPHAMHSTPADSASASARTPAPLASATSTRASSNASRRSTPVRVHVHVLAAPACACASRRSTPVRVHVHVLAALAALACACASRRSSLVHRGISRACHMYASSAHAAPVAGGRPWTTPRDQQRCVSRAHCVNLCARDSCVFTPFCVAVSLRDPSKIGDAEPLQFRKTVKLEGAACGGEIQQLYAPVVKADIAVPRAAQAGGGAEGSRKVRARRSSYARALVLARGIASGRFLLWKQTSRESGVDGGAAGASGARARVDADDSSGNSRDISSDRRPSTVMVEEAARKPSTYSRGKLQDGMTFSRSVSLDHANGQTVMQARHPPSSGAPHSTPECWHRPPPSYCPRFLLSPIPTSSVTLASFTLASRNAPCLSRLLALLASRLPPSCSLLAAPP